MTKRTRRKETGEQVNPAPPAPPPPSPPNQTATDRRNWFRKQAGWPVKGNK